MASPLQEEFGDLPPPPPPPLDPNVIPIKAVPRDISPPFGPPKQERQMIPRPSLGRKGKPISLITNHFGVHYDSRRNAEEFFYHYSVSLKYEDDRPVDGKGIGRRVIDKLHQTYKDDLGRKDFAYDGEKSLFTVGQLPNVRDEFIVVLEQVSSTKNASNDCPVGDSPGGNDHKRLKRQYGTKTFKVALNFASKVPMKAIDLALKGQDSENSQEALRVLDIILRQHASVQGCLLVRQSYFHNSPSNLTDIGGGVMGCRGFHSSFRTSQGGLSLNMDVTTSMIVRPGPVIDFLLANQNARDPYQLDWAKAKRALKNLRIIVHPSNLEYKIVGLSDLPCNEQLFTLKQRMDTNGNSDPQTTEITVYEYYKNYKNTDVSRTADFPCINVGKPKRPTFIPLEMCKLVPLQRYTKSLTTFQRASLVEKSRQKPPERMGVIKDALKLNNYDANSMLRACGVTINNNFTQVEGRILQPPSLKAGNNEDFVPRGGRWNFNQKKLVEPINVQRWAVVNFSARYNIRALIDDLIKCGKMKGIVVDQPFDLIEEDPSSRRAPPVVRVNKMIDQMKERLPGAPKFLLCILAERKNSDIYGPWKRKCLSEFGIVTQCIAPTRHNDQYLTNVLLKINAKLDGMNSRPNAEGIPNGIPLVTSTPTLILGMDVSHGSPGQSDVPSIAAVVSSRKWPSISRYCARMRSQSPKVEMINSLFKPKSDKEDNGIIRELLIEFYSSSGKRKPNHIIIFRDGVSESQFKQVLNIELDQIIEACKFLDEQWKPKFTVIIAQKNHHTRFFLPNSPDNVPPGTVIDNKICHPKNYDFYLCAHAGMIGTTRPTHYHVLYDEIGFTADNLQELVHSLSYVYQRSTSAVSIVAPVYYAHLAATQMRQMCKTEDMSETSSGHGTHTSSGIIPVAELPILHDNVSHSMFFC